MDEELIKQKITLPLKKFIRENYKLQSRAAREFHISPSMLTLIMQGKRKPTKYMITVLQQHNFDTNVFMTLYDINIPEKIDNYEQFRFILSSLVSTIYAQGRSIDALTMQLRNATADAIEAKKKVTELKKLLRDNLIGKNFTDL